jgi:hypothetical protein
MAEGHLEHDAIMYSAFNALTGASNKNGKVATAKQVGYCEKWYKG